MKHTPPVVVPRTTERWELTARRDGIIFCDYTTRTQYHEVSLFLTNTMLVYIIEGKKIVHRPAGDLVLNPGQGFLAAKGDHLFSETFPESGKFRALLFYFDDQVLLEVFRDLSLGGDSSPSVLKAPHFWVFTPEAHLVALFQTIPPYFKPFRPISKIRNSFHTAWFWEKLRKYFGFWLKPRKGEGIFLGYLGEAPSFPG